jgi:hypothetical protein
VPNPGHKCHGRMPGKAWLGRRGLVQLDTGIPATPGEEGVRVGHPQNLSERATLVGCMLVVRLADAITDPVAKITGFFQSAVVEPVREVGLVLIADEGRLDLLFTAFVAVAQEGIGGAAGDQFAGELGGPLDDRDLEYGRMLGVVQGRRVTRLLDMSILVRADVDEPVLQVGIHPAHRAQALEPDHDAGSIRHAGRLGASDHDCHGRECRLRIEPCQLG